MLYILEFASQHLTGPHGQVEMLTFYGLHAGQLIHAETAFTVLGPRRCLGIHFAPLDNLFVSVLIGNLC